MHSNESNRGQNGGLGLVLLTKMETISLKKRKKLGGHFCLLVFIEPLSQDTHTFLSPSTVKDLTTPSTVALKVLSGM